MIIAGCACAQIWATTEITFMHAMGGKLGEAVNELADSFNKSQKDYLVKPVYKESYEVAMQSAIASFRAGKHPNIVQIVEVGTANFVDAAGAVYPIEKLMKDTNTPFDAEDFIPTVKNMYAVNGVFSGMPFNTSTVVMFYNQDLLEKLGEKESTTWEDIRRLSKRAMAEEGASSGYGLPKWAATWYPFENFSAWHNQPIATYMNGFAGKKTRLLFQNPAMEKQLENIKKDASDKLIMYGNDSPTAFIAGKIPFQICSSACFAWFNSSIKDFKFGITTQPLEKEAASTAQNSGIGGAALWALRGKSDEENKATAAFLAFLVKPENQYLWSYRTGYVPVTFSGYKHSEKMGLYDDPRRAVAIKSLTRNPETVNSGGYRLGDYIKIRAIITREVEKIILQNADVRESLATIVSEGNQILEKYQKVHDK